MPVSNRAMIVKRREAVAQLRLRGATVREIAEKLPLAPLYIINRQTGRPFTHTTVVNDLKAVEQEWRANAVRSRAVHKAELLAEIEAAKRMAWQTSDYNVLARFLKMKADLLGLDEPLQLDLSWKNELIERGLDATDANAIFEAMVAHFTRSDA